MVGETGFEPATLVPKTSALPSCATHRQIYLFEKPCESIKWCEGET